jgi:hypothetical protein
MVLFFSKIILSAIDVMRLRMIADRRTIALLPEYSTTG